MQTLSELVMISRDRSVPMNVVLSISKVLKILRTVRLSWDDCSIAA
jgi:hypothetical protein